MSFVFSFRIILYVNVVYLHRLAAGANLRAFCNFSVLMACHGYIFRLVARTIPHLRAKSNPCVKKGQNLGKSRMGILGDFIGDPEKGPFYKAFPHSPSPSVPTRPPRRIAPLRFAPADSSQEHRHVVRQRDLLARRPDIAVYELVAIRNLRLSQNFV